LPQPSVSVVARVGEFDPILVKPEITLEYESLDTDMTPCAPIAKAFKPITPYLAVVRDSAGKVKSVIVHGNSLIKIKRGNVDVSARYTPLRYMNIWEADLDTQSQRVGPYEKSTPGKGFATDSKDYEKGVWCDIPGMRYFSEELGRKRFLYEFIVTAQRRQVHWIYFIVIFDITSTNFRVRMSNAITITPAIASDVNPHKPRTTPFRDESTSGPTAITWAKDSGSQSYVDPTTQVDVMKALPP
jgi:hypothetical protein